MYQQQLPKIEDVVQFQILVAQFSLVSWPLFAIREDDFWTISGPSLIHRAPPGWDNPAGILHWWPCVPCAPLAELPILSTYGEFSVWSCFDHTPIMERVWSDPLPTLQVAMATARALYKNVGCRWPGSLNFLNGRAHVCQYIDARIRQGPLNFLAIS